LLSCCQSLAHIIENRFQNVVHPNWHMTCIHIAYVLRQFCPILYVNLSFFYYKNRLLKCCHITHCQFVASQYLLLFPQKTFSGALKDQKLCQCCLLMHKNIIF
jgi:hypothetical protein